MKRRNRLALAVLVAVLAFALVPSIAYAGYSIDDVREMIGTLSEDPRDFSLGDKARVEEIEAAYESLSEADRSTLDSETGKGSSQPYGRVLEAAVWSVKSCEAPDNSTTLVDGVYDATTIPALSSTYSKGKSTSPRDRPWSVSSVEVRGGKAYATVTVDSSTYPSIITGGKTYENASTSGDCTFVDVPIDLNSTFYFAGVSSSMPRPIAFSLTTDIFEPGVDSDTRVMTVTSATKTFKPGGTALATYTTGVVAGAEVETLEVDLGMVDSLFDRVEYPSVIDDALEDAAAALKDGAFNLVLRNAGGVVSFASGEPIDMKFRIGLTGAWVEHQVTVDLDANTIAVSGGELGAVEVEAMIEKLPADPWKVAESDSDNIALVSSVYDSLTKAGRDEVDRDQYGHQSYGRALEQAIWALEARKAIDNSTTLADGDYTGQVKTSSSMGKSASVRNNKFEVLKVTVADGKATALIEYSGTSADMVFTNGKVYRHVNTDESQRSRFEVPIKLNEPLFLVQLAKNPTANTVGITYQIVAKGDEASMKADKPGAQGGGDGGGGDGDGGKGDGDDNGDDGDGNGGKGDGDADGDGGKGDGSGSGGGNGEGGGNGGNGGGSGEGGGAGAGGGGGNGGLAVAGVAGQGSSSDGADSGASGRGASSNAAASRTSSKSAASSSSSNRASASGSSSASRSSSSDGSAREKDGGSAGQARTSSAVTDEADAGGQDSEASFALAVLLAVCPVVVLVAGAAAFALWFARREMSPVSAILTKAW